MKLKVPFVVLFILLLSSCAPRGETKSLDEIYSAAKERYTVSLAASAAVPVSSTLQDLGSLLNKLVDAESSSSVAQDSATVASLLAGLTSHAGYTSRPALGAIADQYRSLSSDKASTVAARKLLVARTFTLLSSELETTKFGVV